MLTIDICSIFYAWHYYITLLLLVVVLQFSPKLYIFLILLWSDGDTCNDNFILESAPEDSQITGQNMLVNMLHIKIHHKIKVHLLVVHTFDKSA